MPRWFHSLRLRLRSIVRRSRVEDELRDELLFHLEQLTEESIARGMAPADARDAALRAMDGLEQQKEKCRDARRVGLADSIARDVRYAVRVLRRAPGFTAVAVLSLALGVGANAAIFQLLDALRLRWLPVPHADRLAAVRMANRAPRAATGNFNGRYPEFTNPQWEWIRERQQAFDGMFAWSTANFDLSTRGEQRFAENAIWVSGDFFTVLGVPAAMGRVFSAADDVRGCGSPGVVVSHAFWRRELDASPSAVGTTISVNGRPLDVIGVTPSWFRGVEVGRSFDFAVPLCADALINGDRQRLTHGWTWWLSVMGRLKPGLSIDEASRQLDAMAPRLFADTLPAGYSAEAATSYLAFGLRAESASSGVSRLRQQYDTPLWLLLSIAAVVLLIACANLANLLLARAGARRREIVVRLALGASRGRLVRQLLVESLVLASLGGAVAIALAPALSRTVIALISSDVDQLFVDLAVDWRLTTFTAAVSLVTCIVFGLTPALHATRVSGGDAIASGARATAGPRRARLQRALLVGQIALSLTLVVGGLLFARSLYNLMTVDAGFARDGILEVDLDYRRLALTDDRRRAFHQEVIESLRAIPGVDGTASAGTIPLVGNWSQFVFFDGSRDRRGRSNFNLVSDGYFATLGIPMITGRDFNARDEPEPASERVGIVSAAFVRKYFPDANPLGATFHLEGAGGALTTRVQIVGVVHDTKYSDLREPFAPIVYLSASQLAQPGPWQQILIRSRLPLAVLMPSVARAIRDLNGDAAFHYHVFREQMLDSIRQERLMAILCGFFACVAAALATVGLYGVMSYSVAQRTTEIGIRLALGADRRRILRSILGEAAVLVGLGLAVGAALTLATTRAAGALLFGLTPYDPVTVAAAMALLAMVAIGATYAPARRAANADPMEALRCD